MNITNESTPEQVLAEFLKMDVPARLHLCAGLYQREDLRPAAVAFLKRTVKDIEMAELMARLGKK